MKRYLLDTHVVIWALMRPKKLAAKTLQILQEELVYVSALSIWEMLSKCDDGRLVLPREPLIPALEATGALMLPLTAEHAEAGLALGTLHGDPIDRMLVGTARIEGMVFVTRDATLLERAAPLLGPLLLEA